MSASAVWEVKTDLRSPSSDILPLFIYENFDHSLGESTRLCFVANSRTVVLHSVDCEYGLDRYHMLYSTDD